MVQIKEPGTVFVKLRFTGKAGAIGQKLKSMLKMAWRHSFMRFAFFGIEEA